MAGRPLKPYPRPETIEECWELIQKLTDKLRRRQFQVSNVKFVADFGLQKDTFIDDIVEVIKPNLSLQEVIAILLNAKWVKYDKKGKLLPGIQGMYLNTLDQIYIKPQRMNHIGKLIDTYLWRIKNEQHQSTIHAN